MTNQELIDEHKALRKQMRALEAAGDMHARNALVPRYRELSDLIDWGYRKGQEVERWAGRTWVVDTIRSVEGSEIHFHGWIVPPELVRERREQMTLF